MAITKISFTRRGSKVNFFGNLIGPFLCFGRKYIQRISRITPTALDERDAYAEPASPIAGKIQRP